MAARPRILIVSQSLPRSAQHVHGTFKRLGMWVDALASVAELEFLFYVPPDVPASPRDVAAHEKRLEDRWKIPLTIRLCTYDDPAPQSRWQAYGPATFSLFQQGRYREVSKPAQVAAFERAVDGRTDLVFAHRLTAMCPVLRSENELPPVLFDLDDIEHLARFRRLGQPPRWLGRRLEYLQLPALWWGERRAIRRATRTFVCSPDDRNYLSRQGLRRISVVPNAVSVPDDVPEPEGKRLLFLGVLSYEPNRNAARNLALEIWPRIRAQVPDATLVLAGGGDDRLGEEVRSEPGVEITGFVEDLDDLYRNIRVVCCPIRAGGGTRFKIVEAAAYGRPVVSTTVGAEGLEFRDGEEILIRDRTDALAEACVVLLRDRERTRTIGRAAREACRRHYDRPRVIETMRRIVRSELDGRL